MVSGFDFPNENQSHGFFRVKNIGSIKWMKSPRGRRVLHDGPYEAGDQTKNSEMATLEHEILRIRNMKIPLKQQNAADNYISNHDTMI
jgi:hypothetical protein